MVIVEALKNIGGISYFPDYNNYAELNLRKHQATVCPQAVSSHILAAATDKNENENDAEGVAECEAGASVDEVAKNAEPLSDA